MNYTPLQLIDLRGDGFADLWFSSGGSKAQGALWSNPRNSGKWNGFSSPQTTDSGFVGETDSFGKNIFPRGHYFFDGPNSYAWRVYPKTGGSAPVIAVYTMVPRCVLPGLSVFVAFS